MADKIRVPTKQELKDAVDAAQARWDGDYINAQKLPDCRLRPCERKTFKGRHGWLWSRVFCMNCGCDGGLIKDDWASSVQYFCKKCEKWGHILACLKPGTAVVPKQLENAMRGQTNAA
jgi:hypothetical protein